jgi:hypothetical protein
MQPQGTSVLNAAYFTALTAEINNLQTCAELQALATTVMASIQAEKNAIEAQLAALAPILALLTVPGANLSAIVSWISNFITSVLTPIYLPYINYATQLAQLTAAVATLATAIENAAANITSCTVTVPPLT